MDSAADSCIRGMVASLGGRSTFLDRYDFDDLAGRGGAPGAIGLNLKLAPEGAKILGAIEGAPADSADITPGDLLTAIDEVDLRGRTLTEVVHLLRGDVGSSVTITIRREGLAEPLRLTLTRQKIHVRAFDGRLLEAGFVLLKTSQLNNSTAGELVQTVARLRRENNAPILGIVLDLRQCSGGLLHESIAVSAAFLPRGTLVTETKGRISDSNRRYSADAKDYVRGHARDPFADLPPELKSAPLVVLIGPTTAAGAEIVASALKDNQRATLVGQRSFGEGTIETIIPLRAGGALKLTTARVYRPNGEELQGKGLEPDVVVEEPAQPGAPASSDDRAVTQARAILRSGSNVGR
jgi:carboxyl-terminal processing protease